MHCYKVIKDGYIIVVGMGYGGTEITPEEYAHILEVMDKRPEPPAGYDYRLTEGLEWEQFEAPVVNAEDEEISDTEALEIIAGGGA